MARILTLLIVFASCAWSCSTGQKLIEDFPSSIDFPSSDRPTDSHEQDSN